MLSLLRWPKVIQTIMQGWQFLKVQNYKKCKKGLNLPNKRKLKYLSEEAPKKVIL